MVIATSPLCHVCIDIVLYSMTNHPLWGSLEKTCFIHIAVHKDLKSILIEIFHKKYSMLLRLFISSIQYNLLLNIRIFHPVIVDIRTNP